MAVLKTRENDADVDAFLESIKDPAQQNDCKQLRLLMQDVTGAPAKMWGKSIIGFGTYHYTYKSGREGDWMETGFSPRKQATTLYFMDALDNYSEILDRLGPHSIGKGCLYIKRLSDIDIHVLRQLIADSVKRIRDNKVQL